MRCLIVEDDCGLAQVFQDCISDMGHEAIVAHSVDGAIHALRTKQIDVLLLDYVLNGDTCEKVADYAALSCPNSRIILLTGSGAFPNGDVKGLSPGIDWLLRKPIPLDDLKAMVDYAEFDAKRNPVTFTPDDLE